MMGWRLIHSNAIGMEAQSNITIVLLKVSVTKGRLREPNPWLQTGSIPMAKPESTEYPVMLVNPIARAPPASSSRPSLPMTTTETTPLRHPAKLMAATGKPMSFILFSSSNIYTIKSRNNFPVREGYVPK